ncbi:MAG: DUF6503 family protein [Opitutaceae bacterium]
MNLKTLNFLTVAVILGTSSLVNSAHALSPLEPQEEMIADAAQNTHGLRAWWSKEVVVADVEIVFGGKAVVDGTFTFEAHGPRSRYDRKDGSSIIFDGETAWVSPADAEAPKGRFHVLTWPWFIMAPFKMQGDGIHLSDLQYNEVEGKSYATILQTFGEDMGDSPDDWYRFYIDPKTKRLDAMSYIVTYGKDTPAASQEPSIIKYLDYVNAGGPLISTRYELWHWNAESHATVGDAPKGTGTVSNINYTTLKQANFTVPADARELPLP